ncbi:GSCOCG00012185001-RA-CDS [Cotesia congregata]|nr:GSCOCG00012185001-RA-CDS [Cotesia congregata]
MMSRLSQSGKPSLTSLYMRPFIQTESKAFSRSINATATCRLSWRYPIVVSIIFCTMLCSKTKLQIVHNFFFSAYLY